jgi:hypothetical protein
MGDNENLAHDFRAYSMQSSNFSVHSITSALNVLYSYPLQLPLSTF